MCLIEQINSPTWTKLRCVMSPEEIKLLENKNIPDAVRAAIADSYLGATERSEEREIKIRRLRFEESNMRWNTPLAVALGALLTITGNFIFDWSSSGNLAELAANAKEREFQYEIIKEELKGDRKTNAERAAVLLFLARAGILNALDTDELVAMAEQQKKNPSENIIPQLASGLSLRSPFDGKVLFDTGSVVTYSHSEDSTDEMKSVVTSAVQEWQKHVNLEIRHTDQYHSADIRIKLSGWSYSMVGRRALFAKSGAATMNIRRQNFSLPVARTEVLHLFGHALGFIHENHNPQSNISWNRQALEDHYVRDQGYSSLQVERAYLSESNEYFCKRDLDVNSIMMISIPAFLTTDGTEYSRGSTLSESDKRCAAEMYP